MAKATGNRALVAAAAKEVRESLAQERRSAARKLADIKWIADNVVPLLPEGVSLPESSYQYQQSSLTLTIDADPSRPWQGLDGTAMLIARTRKALGGEKFKKSIEGYDADNFTTSFSGYGMVAGESVYVRILLPGQKPDSCRIVVEEVYDPTPRGIVKKFRSVCGTATAAA